MTDEARAAESPPRSTVVIPSPTYLYVIFDGPPGPESGRFVEVEDENGEGVSAGKWEERGDGFWTLGPFLQPPTTVTIRPCSHCREGWVCEAHPEKGWPHDDCAGPGMPCQRCTQAAYPTATEQPASDLRAMVEAILEQSAQPPLACYDGDECVAAQRLGLVNDTAERLAVALEREQGVMGEMAEVLAEEHHSRADAVVALSPQAAQHQGAVQARDYPLFADSCPACAALAQYEARQPREASNTEGDSRAVCGDDSQQHCADGSRDHSFLAPQGEQ